MDCLSHRISENRQSLIFQNVYFIGKRSSCDSFLIDGCSIDINISSHMLRLKNSQSSIKSYSLSTPSTSSNHNSLSNLKEQVELMKYIILKVD